MGYVQRHKCKRCKYNYERHMFVTDSGECLDCDVKTGLMPEPADPRRIRNIGGHRFWKWRGRWRPEA